MLNKLRNPKVQGALRHLLTAFGPLLALIMAAEDPIALLHTLISAAGYPSVVGVIMAGIGFYASVTAPEKGK